MSKNQTVINFGYQFSLSPMLPGQHYRSITVDFTPPVSLSSSSKSIVPTFLRDKKFYTPSFIVPRDKEYYLTTSDFQKHKFEERILKATQQNAKLNKFYKNDQIYPVLPTSQFCQVCKTSFVSYQEHIDEPSHIGMIGKSKANSYIHQLSRKVNKQYKKSAKKQKTKKIQKKQTVRGVAKKSRKTRQDTKTKNFPGQQPHPTKSFSISTYAVSIIPTPY